MCTKEGHKSRINGEETFEQIATKLYTVTDAQDVIIAESFSDDRLMGLRWRKIKFYACPMISVVVPRTTDVNLSATVYDVIL